MRTPFEWLAERWSVRPEWVRVAAKATVATCLLIILGGGIVRVSGSGLGCPEWPNCTDAAFTADASVGVHGWIEYGNRLLSVLICVVVGWLIIAARLCRPRDRAVLRGAWLQFWIVVLNAVVGGVTVWMRLSPYVVAAHFFAAILLLTAATITFDRTRACDRTHHEAALLADDRTRRDGRGLTSGGRGLSTALLAVTGALLVVGTAVTGTGPHAGDSSAVTRMPFDRTVIIALHAALAAAAVVLTVLLRTRRRAGLLLAALAGQAGLGVLGLLTGENGVVTVLHILGAALVWTGAVRVFLDDRADSVAPDVEPAVSLSPGPRLRTEEVRSTS